MFIITAVSFFRVCYKVVTWYLFRDFQDMLLHWQLGHCQFPEMERGIFVELKAPLSTSKVSLFNQWATINTPSLMTSEIGPNLFFGILCFEL